MTRTSIDPLCEKYYHVSPYAYCAGDPVNAIDTDGRYITYQNGNRSYVYYKGDFYENKRKTDGNGNWTITGAKVTPSFEHMSRTLNALRKMDNSKNSSIKRVFDAVSNLNDTYEHAIMKRGKRNYTTADDSGKSNININYEVVDNYKNYDDFKDIGLTDYQLLGHELKHSFNLEFHKDKSGRDPESGIEKEEIETVNFENLIRVEEGMEKRTKYRNDIPKEYLK